MSAPMVMLRRAVPSILCCPELRSFSVCTSLMKEKRLSKLNRLLEKKKKKFYFNVNSPGQFNRTINKCATSRKPGRMQPEDSVRLRCLNDNTFQHICDMVNSNLISEELENLNVLILGVRLTGDLGTCRVYWQASGNVESDDKVQEILDRHTFTIRHTLASLRIFSRTPIIVFVRDKLSANTAEVDRLLAQADMGPPDPEYEPDDPIPSAIDMSPIHVHSQNSLNFLNMDLGKINQEIEKYKKTFGPGDSNLIQESSSETTAYTDEDISKSFEQFKVLQRKKRKRKERKSNPIAASFNEEEFQDSMLLEDEFCDIENIDDDDDDDGLQLPPEDTFNR
ncbi:putative ribosome-binding factor A, mitochondrial [Anneissia japonica]|uniref:putative ribosome-binding factor A, mitochondrial n=1 Tax=Anneissia japonica TaxID=1529436 RepID=UPI0014255C24|nr:putative ribosome-binding factor A, mitochondrial [Anneissia japonica]